MNKNSTSCPVEPMCSWIYTECIGRRRSWKMKMLTMSIIGVPLDHGQSRRGVNMGPSAIRYAGAVARLEAIGHEVTDVGDIQVDLAKKAEMNTSKLKNVDEII